MTAGTLAMLALPGVVIGVAITMLLGSLDALMSVKLHNVLCECDHPIDERPMHWEMWGAIMAIVAGTTLLALMIGRSL